MKKIYFMNVLYNYVKLYVKNIVNNNNRQHYTHGYSRRDYKRVVR